jgi:hypothetical protein
MRDTGTREIARHFAFVIALCGVVACGDTGASSGGGSPLQPSGHPTTTVTRLRATVDAVAGTLTFAELPPAGGPTLVAPGPDAAIYGNQGSTVRIYNSPVIVGAPAAGKKTYSANVGIRNLLGYRIGDEQAGLAPPDTMGLYVFVNSAPIVTGTSSPCACTVTVKNPQGTQAFSAGNQPYWFWPELLGPVNGGQDTTLARKPWIFEADTAVTRFGFDVLVSAAWAAPNETRWKVDYEGDSLPDTQSEPKWRLRKTGNGQSTTSAGILNVNPGPSGAEISYYRRDSLATTTSAYIEASLQYAGVSTRTSTARLVIDDNARFVAFGVAGGSVGFIDPNNNFLGTVLAMNTTAAYHRYQLRKYAADSAIFLVDGVRGGKLNYSAFAATPYPGTAPLIQFGMAGPDNSICLWDYVVYEIGTAVP